MFRVLVAVFASLSAVTASAADGAALYKANCAACHGAEGKGGSGPAVAGKSVGVVTAMVNYHPPPMNNIKLSAEETKAVASFVAALK